MLLFHTNQKVTYFLNIAIAQNYQKYHRDNTNGNIQYFIEMYKNNCYE